MVGSSTPRAMKMKSTLFNDLISPLAPIFSSSVGANSMQSTRM